MMQVAGIEVHRGPRVVLKDIDFHIGRGEVVALAGANGSGKTTLLETCAGILPLASGSVIWRTDADEERVVRDSDGRRNEPPPMGLTLQNDGMCGEETVEERLRISLSASGRSPDKNAVLQVLSEWGLYTGALTASLSSPEGNAAVWQFFADSSRRPSVRTRESYCWMSPRKASMNLEEPS